MNKIGVIQIIDSLNVGGAEVLAVNIANGLSELKIDSHLCTTRSEGFLKESIDKEVGYIFLGRKKAIDFNAIKKLNTYIKKHQIKIIHAHSSSSFIAVCVKLINPRIKIVWHDHYGNSSFLDKRSAFFLKIQSYFFSTVVSVNNDLKNWALKNLKINSVFFIRNFPVFNNLEIKTTLAGEKGKRIVHLAGYRTQKDHLNLLNAFLKTTANYPDWTLHLVGKSYDNSYSNSIQEFILKNNLVNKVFQYGVCTDIKNILSQATFGVLSSKSEGLPIALLEYGLANVAAIVTNVGECNLIVKDPRFIVPPSNSTILATAFMLLMKSDEEVRTLASEINKTIVLSFSQKEAIFKLIEVYRKEC